MRFGIAAALALVAAGGTVRWWKGSVPGDKSVAPESSGTPRSGGEVIWFNNFDDGDLKGLTLWGTPSPKIVTDPTATGGKALAVIWSRGENNRGAAISFAPEPAVAVRFRYKAPHGANVSGIMKLIRFRGPGDRAIGTINIQWGQFLFFGDDFGDGANHPAAGASPASCVSQWCWVEATLDLSQPGHRHIQLSINDRRILDYVDVIPWTKGIATVYFTGVFNDPGDSRIDLIDEATVGRPPLPRS